MGRGAGGIVGGWVAGAAARRGRRAGGDSISAAMSISWVGTSDGDDARALGALSDGGNSPGGNFGVGDFGVGDLDVADLDVADLDVADLDIVDLDVAYLATLGGGCLLLPGLGQRLLLQRFQIDGRKRLRRRLWLVGRTRRRRTIDGRNRRRDLLEIEIVVDHHLVLDDLAHRFGLRLDGAGSTTSSGPPVT